MLVAAAPAQRPSSCIGIGDEDKAGPRTLDLDKSPAGLREEGSSARPPVSGVWLRRRRGLPCPWLPVCGGFMGGSD